MAEIRMNSKDALVLAAMAKIGASEYECWEIADMVEVFFKKCSTSLTENYYWRHTDLMALIDIVLTEYPMPKQQSRSD